MTAHPSQRPLLVATVLLLSLSLSLEAHAAITLQEVVTGNGGSSTVTLPSIQGGSSQTYVVFIVTQKNKDVTAVSGGGLTWIEQKEQCGAANVAGSRIWTAQGSPASAFQLQITKSGTDKLSAVLARYTGVSTLEGAAGENKHGLNDTSCGGGETSTAQLTLTSTQANSVHLVGVGRVAKNVSSFSPGYSLLGSDTGTTAKSDFYAKTITTATSDQFQATLNGEDSWATAGVVLNPQAASAHFAISHDGAATTCAPENITITHHDSTHATVTGYTGTITLSTSTANGNWSLVTGSGTFVNSGSGSATYSFVGADAGSVVLGLQNSTPETLSINVTDGSASEDSSEDPDLAFGTTGSITLEETTTGGATASPASTATIQGGTNQTYVLFVSTGHNGTINSVSGGGLTWTEQKQQCGTKSKTTIEVWTAQGSPGSFQVQIGFDTVRPVSWVFSRYSGVASFEDPTGANPDGENAGCGGGTKSSSVALTLTSTKASSVHAIGVCPKDQTVSSFASGYSATGQGTGGSGKETIHTYVYSRTFSTATTDTFTASLSAKTWWSSAGIVLNPSAAGNSCGTVDHFAISHDGSAVNCQAENVTIRAHDASHAVDTSFTGTISLTTSTAHGDWSLVTGGGTLTNSGSGAASYVFAAGDAGQVVLGLKDTYSETVDINVSDGSASEAAAEDPSLSYASAGFVFLADGIKNTIGTQIGGKASNVAPGAQTLELQAVRTSDETGACEAAFTGTQTIELAFECENPSTCGTNQVTINGTAIAGSPSGSVSSYTGVGLDFGDATDTTASFVLSYLDVGQVQLHARTVLSPSGETLIGSSNSFVFRPFGFDVSVTGNPGASGPSDTIFTSAGTAFTTSVRAVLWSAADDADGDGVPDGHGDSDPSNNTNLSDNVAASRYGQESPVETVGLGAALFAPSGGNDPGLQGGTALTSFSAGAASSTTAYYPEVGIVELSATVADASYLGIGATETAKSVGRSGYVGRFTPFDFGVATNTPSFAAGCASGAFTYVGQPFVYATVPVLTVTARNLQGTTTQNYTGSWWKLTNTSLTGRSYTAAAGSLDTSGLPTTSADPTIVDGGNGSGTLTFAAGSGLLFTRAGPVAPFEAELSLAINVIDSDGIAYVSNPARFGVASAGNGIAFTGGKTQRWGRMRLENANGSELLSLSVPLRAEYYDGLGFVTHSSDSCSSLPLAELSLTQSPAGLSIATLANDPLLMGDAGLSFSAPGAGNTGTIDITADLTSSTGAALEWLFYDWDGDGGHDDNPTGRATFGIFKGDDAVIFLREVY
ncbi:MAG: DUF6701 domain-containing protein [Myxococcota bacterium]